MEDVFWEKTDKLTKENKEMRSWWFLMLLIGFLVGLIIGMGMR